MAASLDALGEGGRLPDGSGAVAPLIDIPLANDESSSPPLEVCNALVSALRHSGFLRITTPLVPLELQRRALEAATEFLEAHPPPDAGESTEESNDSVRPEVVTHPTDPKKYAMLGTREDCRAASPVLEEYRTALESAKIAVLRCLAVGLGLDAQYFARLHDEDNSSLRLLRYPKASEAEAETTGNRCKEHSDYGTITLLLTDGASGLEAFHDGQWVPVPHSPGSLVINAGSLLERWTNNRIPATLHRVAGPASKGSTSPREVLKEAVGRDRTSIAFFADPNRAAAAVLQTEEEGGSGDDGAVDDGVDVKRMSVAEYIQWRSGGNETDAKRSGLAFTEEEEERVRGMKRKEHP